MKRFSSNENLLASMNYNDGKTLVVGSKIYGECVDRRTLYTDAIGLDMQSGDGVDIVHNLDAPIPEEYGKFDHVDCSSVLEHCKRPWLVAENIQQAMNPKATLYVQAPFVWRVHDYPGDYFRYTTESLAILFPLIRWTKLGYFSNGQFRKLTGSLRHSEKIYMERSEAVGVGFLID